MNIISPSYQILYFPQANEVLKRIESAGRTCYKSEERITSGSAKAFVTKIIKSGHHSVIEHINITIKFICDRGVTHELVRHRLASYSQESTRYANYSEDNFGREITVIRPLFWDEGTPEYEEWRLSMEQAEIYYMKLMDMGARPEEARSVLPNSLKSEIVVTCNVREWRHIFSLRCSKAAHPQMREIMIPLLTELSQKIPIVFDDIYGQINDGR